MMVSVAAYTDSIRHTEAVPSNRCVPLSEHCTYSRNDSQLTGCSSCSEYATTSSEHEYEAETSLPLSPHPTVLALGRLFAPQDFDILESLGEGFFSLVHKIRVRETGEVLVLKVAKGGGSRRGERLGIAREMAMLRRLSHPNVLGLKGVCVERSKFGWDAHLLMDFCSGGSLSRLVLDSSRPMSWPERASYALDISRAMHYIHSQGIIHRDLTSMNVLLQKRAPHDEGWDRVVVSDFGLSCEFPKNVEVLAQVGTTYFMSPECLNEEYYDEKSDVFSFGIILCQLIARIDADPDSGLHRTSRFGLNYVLFTSYCPPDTPIQFLQLAFTCCLMNPASRPSFATIVSELSRMSITRPPSPESLRRLQAGRISRSRSDAALRNQLRLRLSLRKPKKTFHSIDPVREGEAVLAPVRVEVSALERLARGVADAESARTAETSNPFLDHERFRRERKIVPHRDPTRRRSETKHEDGVRPCPIRIAMRRCSSLPSGIENLLPGEDSDSADGPGAGGIPMAFRDWDLTFIREAKTMKRFPSRRHTLTPTVRHSASDDVDGNASSATSPTVSSIMETVFERAVDCVSFSGQHMQRSADITSSACSLSPCAQLSSLCGPTGDRLNNNPAKRKAVADLRWDSEEIENNPTVDDGKVETIARVAAPFRCDPRAPSVVQKCAIL